MLFDWEYSFQTSPNRKSDRKELDLYGEEQVTGLPGFLDYQQLDLPGLLLTSRLLCIFRLLHMNLDLAVLTKELNQKWHKVKRTHKEHKTLQQAFCLRPVLLKRSPTQQIQVISFRGQNPTRVVAFWEVKQKCSAPNIAVVKNTLQFVF